MACYMLQEMQYINLQGTPCIKGHIKIPSRWLQQKWLQHPMRKNSIYYISMLQLAAEYGGYNQWILTSPFKQIATQNCYLLATSVIGFRALSAAEVCHM